MRMNLNPKFAFQQYSIMFVLVFTIMISMRLPWIVMALQGRGRREGKGDVTKAECDRESLFSRIGELFPCCLLFRFLSSLDFREKNKSHTSSHLISSHLDSSKY